MIEAIVILLFCFLFLAFPSYVISKKDEIPSFVECFLTFLGTSIVSLVVLLLLVAIFDSVQPESTTSNQNSNSCEYIVTVDFNMDYNHHVGNDWSYKATVDKTVIYSDGINITASVGQEIDLYAKCVEHDDGSSDVEESSCYIVIEKGDIGQSFSVTDEVIVTENDGRYKGNTAKFTVTYYFDPV